MGVSRVKCRGSANPDDRRLREGATAGRQHDCTFDTLDKLVRDLNEAIGLGISTFKTWSGLSSNDGSGFV